MVVSNDIRSLIIGCRSKNIYHQNANWNDEIMAQTSKLVNKEKFTALIFSVTNSICNGLTIDT